MNSGFNGFPPDLFQFLRELKTHNNRDWFQANKSRYQQSVVEPMGEFINAMAPRLAKISSAFVADARPNGGSMFRIYRDARFSKDKSPYKTNVGCQFRHVAGKDAHAPGFYLHLEPGNVFFGGGLWMPPGPALFNIRQAIAERSTEWQKITRAKKISDRFGELGGDALQRVPRGFAPDHPCAEDLKRKSFVYVQTADDADVLNRQFVADVDKSFQALKDFMGFLTRANGLAF